MKNALLVVAVSFLLYTIYQAFTTTLFVSNFPLVLLRLPHFIESSQPDLQLGLFLFQEIAGSIGSYLRLIGAIFALNFAVLFYKEDSKYFERFKRVIFFESVYFLLLFPAAINHIVGSIISSSEFLNLYTGLSCLFQGVLIFPALFMLSRKLKDPKDLNLIQKWMGLAVPLYIFGFWVRHGFLWVYALLPFGAQQGGLIDAIGSANSLLTLLLAAVLFTVASFSFRQTKMLNLRLVGSAIILVGVYFVVYDLVSIWNTTYRSFLPLTDFWMVTLLIVGIALLFGSEY